MRAEMYSLNALRRGLVSLVCGRAVSAGLTMLGMVLVARSLPVAEFGIYAMLLSTLALATTYTSLGLDWVSARYLPEFRIYGSTADLRRFVGWFVVARVASFAVLALALLVLDDALARWMGIGDFTYELAIYFAVILFEGVVRSFRSDLFEPLLLQMNSQANAALRASVFMAMLGRGLWEGGLTLDEVVMADLVASAVSLAVASVQLALYSWRHLRGHERGEGWRPPSLREVFATGGHNYLAQLISSVASPNTLMLMGASMIGPAALAGFGFCRTFSDQIRRYLPVTLFIPLVRPKIVAGYSIEGRFDRLLDRVHLMYKANLIVLMPMVILAAASGDEILDMIAGGKYGDAWLVAVGFAVYLVMQSHRVVLSLVTNILDCPGLTAIGSTASVVALPLAFGLLYAGAGVEGLMVALLLGELISHIVIIRELWRRGYRYTFAGRGYGRLLAATAATIAGTPFLVPPVAATLGHWPAVAAPVLLFGVLILLLWPLTAYERGAVTRIIGWKRGAAPVPAEPVASPVRGNVTQ